MSSERFKDRYKKDDIPWDLGRADHNLIHAVTQNPMIPHCKALDIGCGTGDNAIWLASEDFIVTGCDISEIAIAKAEEKAVKAKVECKFITLDFL